MIEEWERIPEFPKYEVSNYGRVRRSQTGRVLSLQENNRGVITVGLMGDYLVDGDYKQHRRSVPLLVAHAFLRRTKIMGEAFNTPICLNGDRTNNRVDNLEWRPYWFARQYNRQFLHPYPGGITSPVLEVETGQVWPNSFEPCRRYGLLEKDLVLSIVNMTVVWPTYQLFEVIP